MITLDVIQVGELPNGCLEGFKAFASIADNSQDALLSSMLSRAMLRVQEMADRSLLPCRFRLTDDSIECGIVRIYQNVKTIDLVEDGCGNAIPYTRCNRILSIGQVDSAVVEYTTEATEGNQHDLMPVVYQYATALYDGQDSRSLANILMQCR